MTTLRVNSPKGKPLTNPRINTYSVFKKWNFTNLFVYVCFYLLLLHQTAKSDKKLLV